MEAGVKRLSEDTEVRQGWTVGSTGAMSSGEGRLQLVFSCSAGEEAGELDLEGEETLQLAHPFSCSA